MDRLRDQRPDRGRVQRALDGLYERLGSQITWFAVGVVILLGLPAAIVFCAAGARLLNLPFSDGVLVVVIWMPIVFGLAAIGVVTSRDTRNMVAWSRDPTPERAIRAWNAVMSIPRVVTRGAIFATPGLFGAAIFIIAKGGLPVWELAPCVYGGFASVVSFWVLAVYGAELLLRPMAEDIARALPIGFRPKRPRLPFAVKVFLPLPAVTLMAAGLVGAYANLASGTARLPIMEGLSTASVAIAAAIFMIVSRSLLDPIRDLTEATRRVQAGDLETPVPVGRADDLGVLTQNFNEMLVGLREREALRDDLRESRERIVAAADEARRRLERDLHDGAQQQLVLVGLKLSMAQRLVESDPDSANAALSELHADVERALADLRDLAHGIYPARLESDGLRGALDEVTRGAVLPATLDGDGVGRYRPEIEAAVYFCCLEALQNAAKHAGEQAHVTVRLAERSGELEFEVADDGSGFDTAGVAESSGVQNMTDRIGALGGELRVVSAPGRGTTVAGTIPLSD